MDADVCNSVPPPSSSPSWCADSSHPPQQAPPRKPLRDEEFNRLFQRAALLPPSPLQRQSSREAQRQGSFSLPMRPGSAPSSPLLERQNSKRASLASLSLSRQSSVRGSEWLDLAPFDTASVTSGEGTMDDMPPPRSTDRDASGTATSTSFWTISDGFISHIPCRTRRAMLSTWCPCLLDADRCLHSDAMTNSHPQASPRARPPARRRLVPFNGRRRCGHRATR